MKELTVIIPVHEYSDTVKALLGKAIESFHNTARDDEKLLVASPAKVKSEIEKDFSDLEFVETKKSDFVSQINTAAKAVTTKYFSILEFDDVFTTNWLKNVAEYFEYEPDASLYLPLTEVLMAGEEEKGPIGYVNEAAWASSFSDEIGYLDLESLQNYMNFNTTGGIFKTEDFLAVGALKPSIKLSFWYEFLLRLVHNKRKVFVVPKVGYRHLLGRKGSVSDTYNKEMEPKEAEFWVDLAKKEYMFKTDRKKTYEA